MELATLLTAINCPLGAAAVILAGYFAPKLMAVVSPIAAALLKRLRPAAPAAPAAPVVPADPAPDAPAVPEQVPDLLPNRPLLNAGLKVLMSLAQRRFPHLAEAEAFERYIVTEAAYVAHHDEPPKPDAPDVPF